MRNFLVGITNENEHSREMSSKVSETTNKLAYLLFIRFLNLLNINVCLHVHFIYTSKTNTRHNVLQHERISNEEIQEMHVAYL